MAKLIWWVNANRVRVPKWLLISLVAVTSWALVWPTRGVALLATAIFIVLVSFVILVLLIIAATEGID